MEEEEGEVRARGGRSVKARGRSLYAGRAVRPGTSRGRGWRGRSEAVPRGRAGRGRSQAAPRGRGRGRGRGQAGQQERMEEGGQPPAQGMEAGPVRGLEGEQHPAQRMEHGSERMEVEGQFPAHGMEDVADRREEGRPIPAQQQAEQQREVRGLEEGEGEDITERIRPVIPPANPEAGRGLDVDGWADIGRVGAWDAMLSEFSLLDEVPEQHKLVWVWAAAEVLRRLHLAETEEETTRALMWWCFLPQALLRKPSRGKKEGRGLVAKRFNSLGKERNWGTIVDMWEVDREKERRRREARRAPREEKEEDKMARLRREVVGLINSGKISKALQRVTSCGVANIEDPAILAMLQSKYPASRKGGVFQPASFPSRWQKSALHPAGKSGDVGRQ